MDSVNHNKVHKISSIDIPTDFKSTLPPRKRAKTKEEKEQRRIERILRNRKAAHQSREKKRLHLKFLEDKCSIMEGILTNLDLQGFFKDQPDKLKLVESLNELSQEDVNSTPVKSMDKSSDEEEELDHSKSSFDFGFDFSLNTVKTAIPSPSTSTSTSDRTMSPLTTNDEYIKLEEVDINQIMMDTPPSSIFDDNDDSNMSLSLNTNLLFTQDNNNTLTTEDDVTLMNTNPGSFDLDNWRNPAAITLSL